MRIALLSPPFLPVPPPAYAGTERIVAVLARGLHERGHDVTLFAPGDSNVPYRLVPTIPEALWRSEDPGDVVAYFGLTMAKAAAQADRFDIIHSHLDAAGILMSRLVPTPVIATLHGRLDIDGVSALIDALPDIPLVSISDSQRRWNEGAHWIATIHHGLDFSTTPMGHAAGDYLLLVGRVTHEKGVVEGIEVARRTGRRLVMAAKVRHASERELFERVVRPAIDEGVVDWRGEVETGVRDELMAGAMATLMLGGWPEPFGLVAIESMATGTPVIARRAGAYTETVEHGRTGFLVDDVDEAVLALGRIPGLDRSGVANRARTRFSADRMVDAYLDAYAAVLGRRLPLTAASSMGTVVELPARARPRPAPTDEPVVADALGTGTGVAVADRGGGRPPGTR